MEFDGELVASAGMSPDASWLMKECMFAADEAVTQVKVDGKQKWQSSFPSRVEFTTSMKTCSGGTATGDTQTFSGERLLYSKGKVGAYFDNLGLVFSSC